MSTLDVTRAKLALIALYLNTAKARDKICRAIQYGSKFISEGSLAQPKMLTIQLAWQGKFSDFLSFGYIL
ncbi:hypothetical protein SLEP1_g36322 [Rubroshorea leprosula]|uniref:Uncharacterized protein n=1 Tax=Rubroshorea leprosula TaxID=152421 RepID=A0AAV5KR44_9ROSI|nr:hypothetical protein SLEP1_g36322 [Rubroshorea leprosula]